MFQISTIAIVGMVTLSQPLSSVRDIEWRSGDETFRTVVVLTITQDQFDQVLTAEEMHVQSRHQVYTTGLFRNELIDGKSCQWITLEVDRGITAETMQEWPKVAIERQKVGDPMPVTLVTSGGRTWKWTIPYTGQLDGIAEEIAKRLEAENEGDAFLADVPAGLRESASLLSRTFLDPQWGALNHRYILRIIELLTGDESESVEAVERVSVDTGRWPTAEQQGLRLNCAGPPAFQGGRPEAVSVD